MTTLTTDKYISLQKLKFISESDELDECQLQSYLNRIIFTQSNPASSDAWRFTAVEYVLVASGNLLRQFLIRRQLFFIAMPNETHWHATARTAANLHKTCGEHRGRSDRIRMLIAEMKRCNYRQRCAPGHRLAAMILISS